MKNQRRLIINADDLGRTPGINEGIFDAHRRGVVTSATMMVNYGPAEAVPALSAKSPGLGIGLHVQVTGGAPALPKERVRSLVDDAGRLPAKPEGLGGASAPEVLEEAREQLARFRKIMNRDPTHFDSHHHSHRTPAVLEALVALGRETGRPVRAASPEVAARLRREGIRTTDHFVEDFYDRGVTIDALLAIVARAAEGTTELMCHPAVVDEELRSTSGYAEARTRELEVLTDPRVREAIDRAGIRLIHFGQL
jgi:predicted glycoside hydrolase/deacetylase ChbG (UPF0249 family)